MAMPILYVEVFIGRYTQMCCLHYGKMLPLLQGLGAAKIIINFYILNKVLMYSATAIHYFSQIINEPWKKCQLDWMTGCLTLSELMNCRKTTCLNATVQNLSTYLYFRYYQDHKHVQIIVFIIVFGVIGCVTVMIGYHCYRYILFFSFISIITVTTIMILIIIAYKSNIPVNLSKTTDSVMTLQHTTFEGSGNSITRPLITMNLAGSGHILLGTHLSTEIKTTVQILIICVVYLLFIGIGSFLIRLCYYSITSAADWDSIDLSPQEIIYVAFHDFVQEHFRKNGFPVFFDLCCLVLLFSKQVVHIDIISESMIGYFEVLRQHRVYVVCAVASLGLLSVIPHFLVIGLLMYRRQAKISVVVKVLITISLSPLLIGVLYKLIKGIKAKNVLGLFMPEEAWGMRNISQRKLRHMYNPREETHSQTRDPMCKHDCLLDSEILNKVVRDEIESTSLETMPRERNTFGALLSPSTRSEDDLSSVHSTRRTI